MTNYIFYFKIGKSFFLFIQCTGDGINSNGQTANRSREQMFWNTRKKSICCSSYLLSKLLYVNVYYYNIKIQVNLLAFGLKKSFFFK